MPDRATVGLPPEQKFLLPFSLYDARGSKIGDPGKNPDQHNGDQRHDVGETALVAVLPNVCRLPSY